MILERFLSNPSFKSLRYGSFLSVSCPIRFVSGNPRFDFRCMRGLEDAISPFRRMVEMHPRPSVSELCRDSNVEDMADEEEVKKVQTI